MGALGKRDKWASVRAEWAGNDVIMIGGLVLSWIDILVWLAILF